MKKKQQPSIAHLKHLKGEQAKKFYEAFEKSKINEKAVSKVKNILVKDIKGDKIT